MKIVDAAELVAADADSTDFAAMLALQQELDRQRDPDMAVTTPAELAALCSGDSSDYAQHHRLIAFDGTSNIAEAIGHLELPMDTANLNLAGVEITPSSNKTAAAAVLKELLDIARDAGRSSVMASAEATSQHDQFWTSLGAELRYTEQESHLDMGSVDPRLMARWIEAAPTDMQAVHWARHCPDEWIDAAVATANAMKDAPIDDLEVAATVVDAAMLRADIEARAALGLEYHGVIAVTADGEAAGTTEVFINRHRPAASWQWSTVVLPAHRGKSIGRWLKALMWQQLRDCEPEVTGLQTGNAASNSHMLAINIEMGFKPTRLMGCWQGDLNTLQRRLSTLRS